MRPYIHMINEGYSALDTLQMMEVDRLMVEEYQIQLSQMMENAGRCLALLIKERYFKGDVEGKNIVVLAGNGGNGGGAMVAARRLHGWGARVKVAITSPRNAFTSAPKQQLKIIRHIGIEIIEVADLDTLQKCDVIIDGIIGYSLKGDPHGSAAEAIRWANVQDSTVIAMDVPSGLDLTTGAQHNPVINASATMTLAMPKKGLFASGAQNVVGELYLADIGIPQELYCESTLGLKVQNVFRRSDLVRIL